MRWTREEYLAYMTFHDVGRDMFSELFGPLRALEDEWTAAGCPPEERNLSAFGWDSVPTINVRCNTVANTGLTPVILMDTPEEQILIDEMGRKSRLCKKSATIPLPIEYPVTCMEDWLKVKPWYLFSEDRINKEQLEKARKLQKEGWLVLADMPGGFDEPRQLMGEENLCCAYYEEPEMITDMLSTFAETTLKVMERVCEYVVPDNLCVHEDLAGRSGPLVGPAQVREFIKPYYLRVWEEMKRQGCTLFSQDSDGNINPVIDAFLESGINVMFPFEPAAGMDMKAAREKYGSRLAIKGGIDKHALRQGKEAIEKELRYKLCPELRGGGTVFGLDHRIPNGVSMENYRYYVQLGREILGLPPAENFPHGRMAF